MKTLLLFLTVVLVIFSFPAVFFGVRMSDLSFLIWLALVPFLLSLKGLSGRQIFWRTVLCSLLFYTGVLYWVFNAVFHFGGLSVTASCLVELFMSLGLALYCGLGIWLAHFISKRTGFSFYAILPWTWVAQDFGHNYFPAGGFSWANLAYTQGSSDRIVQMVDLGGPYLLTFLFVFVNAAIARFLLEGKKGRGQLVTALLLVVATLGYGQWSLKKWEGKIRDDSQLKVALLQGNIPQDEKWLLDQGSQIEETYQQMMQIVPEAELVIWPEASYPYQIPITKSPFYFPTLKDSFLVPTLVGGVSSLGNSSVIYNSALLVQPGGEVSGVYHKSHLVPLGEYVPHKWFFSFVDKVVPAIGQFEAGRDQMPIEIEKGKVGVLICYEDAFPEVARVMTNRGAHLLVNMTNDAWYGDSSAPIQHLNLSRFRAIENRRAVVRATNTGLTAIIDPLGHIVSQTSLFERNILEGSVPMEGEKSFYTRVGDLFAWIAVGVVGLLLLWKKKNSTN